ncbi:S-type anion channel SLAH2-like [Phalaenopsis equestris]|uniref:S-type anion channel SLAH2-like n=1 Tax=Phalaenopsis equestris TaxID=78828 RepID=UPI0009E615CF|nr:S-type anion channel SLAH2-like [Phalaenopsis equestris]
MEGADAKKGQVYSARADSHPQCSSMEPNESLKRFQSVSIFLPVSDSAADIYQSQKLVFDDKTGRGIGINGQESIPENSDLKNGDSNNTAPTKNFRNFLKRMCSSVSAASRFANWQPHETFKDTSYDAFKKMSGKLERQFSNFRGKPIEPPNVINDSQDTETESLPALDRYLDALEGPELDTLRESEELVLPNDKTWPFLLRFPISTFGICLGVGSQAMLWKALALSPSMSFMNISPTINIVLWCISIGVFSLVASIYLLKIIFYFAAVKREYYHPVRINFFFAPWVACLFFAIGLPPQVGKSIPDILWYVLMVPILCLDLKMYGQWMLGGEQRLSKVANPSNHLAVVGNFVGALLGANIGLKEGPIFFFAVGLAHYTVLFVTLYQRLPTNDTLPKDLHPVFFLFIAAPSVACTAWAKISGEFGIGARIPYFVAMFLYSSLAVRVSFFRGFRFSLAWWAYTFPMAGSAIATIRYADQVNNYSSKALLPLSTVSTLTVSILLLNTIIHAFVFKNLFPNDIAIAISNKKSKSKKSHEPCSRTLAVARPQPELEAQRPPLLAVKRRRHFLQPPTTLSIQAPPPNSWSGSATSSSQPAGRAASPSRRRRPSDLLTLRRRLFTDLSFSLTNPSSPSPACSLILSFPFAGQAVSSAPLPPTRLPLPTKPRTARFLSSPPSRTRSRAEHHPLSWISLCVPLESSVAEAPCRLSFLGG